MCRKAILFVIGTYCPTLGGENWFSILPLCWNYSSFLEFSGGILGFLCIIPYHLQIGIICLLFLFYSFNLFLLSYCSSLCFFFKYYFARKRGVGSSHSLFIILLRLLWAFLHLNDVGSGFVIYSFYYAGIYSSQSYSL